MSLVFSYISKVFFCLGFLQSKDNFVDGQNNSKNRDPFKFLENIIRQWNEKERADNSSMCYNMFRLHCDKNDKVSFSFLQRNQIYSCIRFDTAGIRPLNRCRIFVGYCDKTIQTCGRNVSADSDVELNSTRRKCSI